VPLRHTHPVFVTTFRRRPFIDEMLPRPDTMRTVRAQLDIEEA
jgi:hypothetical protein